MVGGGDMFINTKPTPSVGLVLISEYYWWII